LDKNGKSWKKKENNKEEIPQKVCFKLPQKKRPNQLPTHP